MEMPDVFDSQIICGFSDIFTEVRDKQFSLLWRGSHDGFSVSELHRRCDVPRNNSTATMDGNIFGGFTPFV
jgi:hypothetical protein